MPGHPIPSGVPEERARRDVAELEGLIDNHDAIFLLMDSRESRWLPTLVGKARNKVKHNQFLGLLFLEYN